MPNSAIDKEKFMGEPVRDKGLLRGYKFRSIVGLITIYWSTSELVASIKIEPEKCDFCLHYDELPSALKASVENIRSFIDQGRPIGSIPWALLDTSSISEFQSAVYRATAQIPFGETRSYGWIARSIGKPFATRAVGQALRRNPFPILVPCHRVVSVTDLGGFMGVRDPDKSEVKLKKKLINIESSYVNPYFPFLSSAFSSLEAVG